MREIDLQDAIVSLARAVGWRVAHFRPLRTKHGWRTPGSYDAKGWPDLTLVKHTIIFAEIKLDPRDLRPDQAEWKDRIERAGFDWYLWTPAEWESGEIDRILVPNLRR